MFEKNTLKFSVKNCWHSHRGPFGSPDIVIKNLFQSKYSLKFLYCQVSRENRSSICSGYLYFKIIFIALFNGRIICENKLQEISWSPDSVLRVGYIFNSDFLFGSTVLKRWKPPLCPLSLMCNKMKRIFPFEKSGASAESELEKCSPSGNSSLIYAGHLVHGLITNEPNFYQIKEYKMLSNSEK